MAVTSNRNIDITNAGDHASSTTYSAAQNASAPGKSETLALSTGTNTVTKPTGATAVTIIPPVGNAVAVTFKGVAGDTGVRLHDTDPSSIALHSSVATFVLNAASAVTVRLEWT